VPAIAAAGLKAYRVDRDPAVSIPIIDILYISSLDIAI
jgi:hypothetical protein